MTILVTGAAGFIGYHVAEALMARGDSVIGIDNLNDYYDVSLKQARLARLQRHNSFRFHQINIADRAAMAALDLSGVTRIVHLAAQAGVRYSIENPFAYIETNLLGHTVMLELARHMPKLEHMVYASSSSVYGGNTKLPFSVADRVDQPISVYAATKKADELLSHAYSHLFRIPQTGLRFFTVYGPWGRPDMALFLFTKAILAGQPIKLFNRGDMSRDFTYIDDIVGGVLAVLDRPPADTGAGAPARVYNIGPNHPEPLLRLIDVLETTLGRKAIRQLEPMQPGDVQATYADITDLQRDTGFSPGTPIDVGVPKFVAWYREFYGA